MNPFPVRSFTWSLLLLLSICGCQQPANDSADPASPSSVVVNGTGSAPLANPVQSISDSSLATVPPAASSDEATVKLWQQIQQRYAEAQTYSDQAEWNLQYRLDGQLFVETQPITLKWDRSRTSWYGSAFRSHIWKDHEYLWMTINEAETDNLDHQVKILPQSQWQSVLQDPIARIYLGGETDFPLQPHQGSPSWSPLFFPQLKWLDPSASGPAYLQTNQWQPAGKAVFRGRSCLVLQSMQHQLLTEIWIDPDKKEMVRLFLPNHVLDPRLAGSPQVSDLRLSLDFSDIQWDSPTDIPDFQPSDDQKLVQQFVKVPEEFPCPWVGKPSPPVSWPTLQGGTDWQLDDYAGRNVVAIFLPADEDFGAWCQPLQQLKSRKEFDTAELVLVPILLNQPLSPQTQQMLQGQPFSVAGDGRQAWSQLGLKLQPTMVVWDGHGLVQYVGPIDPAQSSNKIATCLQRLKAGDSIAMEMTSDYQKFYQRYLAELATQKPIVIPPRLIPPSTAQALAQLATDQHATPTGPTALPSVRLELEEEVGATTAETSSAAWTFQCRLPQYAAWTSAGNQQQLWVLDGFQTLVKLSADGTLLDRVPLQLPEGKGVSAFACLADQRLLAWEPGDQQLYLFHHDGSLQSKKSLPQILLNAQVTGEPKSEQAWLVLQNEVQVLSLTDGEWLQRWSIPGIQQVSVSQHHPLMMATGLTQDHVVVELHPGGVARSVATGWSSDPVTASALLEQAESPCLVLTLPSQPHPLLWEVGKESTRILPLPGDTIRGQIGATGSRWHWQSVGKAVLYWSDRQVGITTPGGGNDVSIGPIYQGKINHVAVGKGQMANELIAVCTPDGKVQRLSRSPRLSATEHKTRK